MFLSLPIKAVKVDSWSQKKNPRGEVCMAGVEAGVWIESLWSVVWHLGHGHSGSRQASRAKKKPWCMVNNRGVGVMRQYRNYDIIQFRGWWNYNHCPSIFLQYKTYRMIEMMIWYWTLYQKLIVPRGALHRKFSLSSYKYSTQFCNLNYNSSTF